MIAPIMISTVTEYINQLAPEYLKEEWDHVGLQVGDGHQAVTNVLLALDLTEEILLEAKEKQCNLVITHHPLIFKPLYTINTDDEKGRLILELIKNGIALYCAHTNLDTCSQGTNDALFDKLDLQNKENLLESPHDGYGMGRVGTVKEPVLLQDFAAFMKESLGMERIHYIGENKMIHKVGLCTGASSGMTYFNGALKHQCDVYITGDIKYHDSLDAMAMGLSLIDGTHYHTEVIVLPYLQQYLEEKLKGAGTKIYVTERSVNPFHY